MTEAETREEKKDRLVSYYDRIKHYLVSDINALISSDANGYDVGCGPYLLTVCSGIDFLGSLSLPIESIGNNRGQGLKNISKKGFTYYIRQFLQQINPSYAKDNVAEFIYKIVRSGQVHEAIIKYGVIIGKKYSEYHLKILSILKATYAPDQKEIVIYFNPRIFADDFLDSLDAFAVLLSDDSRVEIMADRLIENLSLSSDDLKESWPDFEEINIDQKSFDELYEWGSAAPNHQGEATLKKDFWQSLI